ncbi:hypothetical protein BDW74DRAFT_175529 [Aspergillus multicolor]|uniref:uncharacterized protein n=1 Tax=Aspergillus multicolor TaxID=41759 RepID=UPI003CCCDCE3
MVPARRGRGRGRPRKDWSARTQRLERPNSRAKVTAPSPQVDAIPSASPSTPAPSTCCTTCSLNVDDIELILHFTTQTAHTLAHPDPPNNLIALFWSQNTPRLGLSCHAVLHLILGLAGYHLAYLTADPRTDPDLQPRARYASLARKHGALGLAELTRTLGNIDESNCGALYTAAVLVSFCTFAAGPTDANDLLACNVGEENANNEARLHPWMSVVQGVRLIAESFEPDVLFSGLVAPLRYRPRPDFEMSSSSRANLPTCIERGLPRINWQGPMDRLRALIVTRGESHVAEVYLENFQRIRSIYEATYGNVDGSVGCESENKFIFIWLYTIEDSFVACVRQKEPLSLLILAYYAVLLTTMKRDCFNGRHLALTALALSQFNPAAQAKLLQSHLLTATTTTTLAPREPAETGKPAECTTLTPNGPLQITPSCIDPLYNIPIITNATDLPLPIPHRQISISFNNTPAIFTLYFPHSTPTGVIPTRFFQLLYPLQNATAEDEAIAFGADSGAYTVSVAAGTGYRGDAAAAKFARILAARYYGLDAADFHGYIYGGSGGSLQVVAALENTEGVWDGGVALVQAVPVSNPNNWAIRALAGSVLDWSGKVGEVVDAVRPGGSGDPFEGLKGLERGVLEEASALGVPVAAWEDFGGVARNRTKLLEVLRTLVIPAVRDADPGYVDDFWSKRGYVGAEESGLGALFRDRLVEFNDTVLALERDEDGVPVALSLHDAGSGLVQQLEKMGAEAPFDLEFTILSHNDTLDSGIFTGLVNPKGGSVFIYRDNNTTVLSRLAEGVRVQADNRWYLAVHTWHRHQVPLVEDGYYGYDYLRDPNNSSPLYSQRDILLAPITSTGASGGGTHTGGIKGKLIVMDNLADYDAFPWHADWYKKRVETALGPQCGNQYRLYYNEHADHHMGPVPTSLQSRLVDFTGLYEQLLRDLSAWVEDGIEPPPQTRYDVHGGQVVVPADASARGGIQPVVTLTVGGANRTEVAAGEAVVLRVRAEVPPGAGEIVSVEWDVEGTGEFSTDIRGANEVGGSVDLEVSHVYGMPGMYFPAVRVASHRDGDMQTPFARALNLGRARVIVH